MTEVIQFATQCGTRFQRVSALGSRADQFFNQHGIRNTATSGGIQAIFYRYVVVNNHGRDLDAAFVQQLGSGFKIQNVTGVIFDD
ncbi:hypothetical protein D3C81_1532380 [compost metagenome]